MKTKSVLSYFGSDSEVAQSLASKLDLAKHVTIPFVGGGAILPWLKARAIVCNDKNALKEKMKAHNKRMKDKHRDRRNAEWRERYKTEIGD